MKRSSLITISFIINLALIILFFKSSIDFIDPAVHLILIVATFFGSVILLIELAIFSISKKNCKSYCEQLNLQDSKQ